MVMMRRRRDEATKEDFSFLTINMKVPARIRFRKKLSEIINIENYVDNDRTGALTDVGSTSLEHPAEVSEGVEAGEGADERRHVAYDGRNGDRSKKGDDR